MKQTHLEKLIEDFNEYCKGVEDYLNSEESMHAEFCQSFGYGDGEIETRQLDDEGRDAVADLEALLPRKSDFQSTLADCCDLLLIGIYITDNEVYSCTIGEHEDQLDDAMVERINSLTPEEFKEFRRDVEAYIPEHDGKMRSDCVYFNRNYDRWVMVLDVEKLKRKVRALKRKARKVEVSCE